ncbi:MULTISPECIES: methionine--tRNA ligase [unclassified Saccharibacter]|uniref:methionine--tRNA ligase n=1 Tax=unclassified Saccharibacter TaxID=2648722 RepID=UPI00132207B6|nr:MULTISPECIES: methionine--tRNA ligase [unclassified Saccharibacter]MXV35386.1 methionine--tRNA ligase [Saccharibacter sp. EH611]MXV57766.1 methionine--tRNA ligase [Saccharibacter sp. EH70]MXV65320.1 methionine--tRNA ligase [Saccharibacter sp. EH60]
MTRRFTITTPIFYVNGAPHIGHAYTSIACDVLARFHRLMGNDVLFVSGTDEHGQKVEQSALAQGVPPQEFADRVSAQFRQMQREMNITADDFVRTTEERHKKSARALWEKVAENGHIYLDAYEGWYSTRDEAFIGEDEITVHPDGSRTAPSGAPVERVREPSYFFRLTDFQDRLLKFYEENPDFIGPAGPKREIESFVKQGLRDLSISRTSFRWGIEVPGDPDHVMYVWFDALANYLTAAGYPDLNSEKWAYWPADVHVVGKEIIRFHCIYWPAFLMAANLPLPKRVFAHGWWTVEGEKMSKSLGNVLDPKALSDEFGLDQLRFFLMREVPFGGDSNFSRRSMITRMNVELANDLGNLAQRTLSQVARNFDGILPERGALTQEDQAILAQAELLPSIVSDYIERLAISDALEEIWKLIRAANAYIDRQAPWVLKKTDKARMADVLRVLVDVIRTVATLLQPYMPDTMDKMLNQLGVQADERTIDALKTPTPGGRQLPKPQGLFPRFVEEG